MQETSGGRKLTVAARRRWKLASGCIEQGVTASKKWQLEDVEASVGSIKVVAAKKLLHQASWSRNQVVARIKLK